MILFRFCPRKDLHMVLWVIFCRHNCFKISRPDSSWQAHILFPLSYSFYTLKHLKNIDKIYFPYDTVEKRDRILNWFRVRVNGWTAWYFSICERAARWHFELNMKTDTFIRFHYSSEGVINISSKYSYQLNLENISPTAPRDLLVVSKRKSLTAAAIKTG